MNGKSQGWAGQSVQQFVTDRSFDNTIQKLFVCSLAVMRGNYYEWKEPGLGWAGQGHFSQICICHLPGDCTKTTLKEDVTGECMQSVSQSGKDLIQEIRKILDLKYWSASMRSRCCLVFWEHHLALFSDWKHFQCYTFWSLSDWKLTEEPKIGYQMQLQTSGRLFWGWDVSQAVTIPQEPNESVISNHLRVQLHHLPSVQLYPQK